MWMTLLQDAVKNTSRTAVALELDVSRTTISLILSGKYPASPDKIAERVLNTYGKVQCPHLAREITLTRCRSHHQAEPPTSSPREMRHWRSCQTCPFKTGGQHE